jgi:protocatechuate 3,4-dioxygenase beta subunit
MRNARLAALALSVCAHLAAQSSGASPEKALCAVEGRVFSAVTGAPLKKAAVWLEAFSPTRGVNGPPTVSGPAATTDANGHFLLEGVEPGSYLLSAQRTGYLDQGYGARDPQVVGPPLKLSAGDRLTDITFKLTPQSLLYGKIADEDGDPLPNSQVDVLRVSYAGGHRQFASVANVNSQDDGSFVVGNLSPGRYYVSAAWRINAQPGPVRERPREAWVTTYFSNTIDPAAAAPVEIAAGAEVRGIEIRLRKSRVFHIRGRVVNIADGTPVSHAYLRLVPRGDATVPQTEIGDYSGSDGRFAIEGVLPGAYTLESADSLVFTTVDPQSDLPRATPAPVGRALVSITDSDIEDLRMPVGEGAVVTGTVTGVSYPAERPTVTLVRPAAGRNLERIAQCSPEGAFQMRRLTPAVYSLDVALPKGAYVKSVKFAGRDVTNADIDLTSGAGGTLEIVASKDGGGVSGTVRDGNGDLARGATVQLWPADGEGAKTVKSDENGGFRFIGLPPASYRLAAWEDLDDDYAEYPPFRALFTDQAAKLTVAERARETVELKLIPRESVAAQTAKLK